MKRAPAPGVLWRARSSNAKTGDIPTAWIGTTREESLATCATVACPLLSVCYAQRGTAALAHSSMAKRIATRGTGGYSIGEALERRHASARAVRIGALGEAGILPAAWWHGVRAAAAAEDLAVLAYTHAWRSRPWLRAHAMASVESLRTADDALRRGFSAFVVLPSSSLPARGAARLRTPGGAPVVPCPAAAVPGVTCNDCRRCDPALHSRPTLIGIEVLGPRAKGWRQ